MVSRTILESLKVAGNVIDYGLNYLKWRDSIVIGKWTEVAGRALEICH